jgi:hypothetical protein
MQRENSDDAFFEGLFEIGIPGLTAPDLLKFENPGLKFKREH